MAVAVLVAAAIRASRGPRGRDPAPWASSGPAAARPGSSGRPRPPGAPRDDLAPASLAGVLTAVSAALRSGQSPAGAWRAVLGCASGPDGVPDLEDLLEATRPSRRGLLALADRARAAAGRGRHEDVRVRRATAVISAGRLAASLGAPLAPVLDRVALSIVADDEVDGDRRAVLAGPRSTAAVLGWLPLVGIGLGVALGADPWGVMLRGGAGTLAAVGGTVLLAVGRWWTARLLHRATLAGDG